MDSIEYALQELENLLAERDQLDVCIARKKYVIAKLMDDLINGGDGDRLIDYLLESKK